MFALSATSARVAPERAASTPRRASSASARATRGVAREGVAAASVSLPSVARERRALSSVCRAAKKDDAPAPGTEAKGLGKATWGGS